MAPTNEAGSIPTRIFYYAPMDLWNKKQKFDFLNERSNTFWQYRLAYRSTRHTHTWLTEGIRAEFETFIPMGTKEAKAAKGETIDVIFKIYSGGVKTNRDAWAYNFNPDVLAENISGMIDTTMNRCSSGNIGGIGMQTLIILWFMMR